MDIKHGHIDNIQETQFNSSVPLLFVSLMAEA